MNTPESERTSKSERYDLKLREILHKSARVFAQKGFHNASMRDISRETGVSLAGLYYYFQTKEELLFLIIQSAFDSVLENLEGSLDRYSGTEKVHFFVENHLRYFVENLPEMKLVSHESDSLSGTYLQKIRDKKRTYFRRLVDILSQPEIQERGGKGKTDPDLAALFLFGMINWPYTWYRPKKSPPIKEIAAGMTRIFLNGYLGS